MTAIYLHTGAGDLAGQLHQCELYAKFRALPIDQGSATTVLGDAIRGQARHIIIHRLDGLGDTPMAMLERLRKIMSKGKFLHVVDLGGLPFATDGDRGITKTVLATLSVCAAEQERPAKRKREVPFGTHAKGNRFVEDPEEMKTVRTIVNWRVIDIARNDKVKTYGAIAIKLNRAGLTRRGEKWNAHTVELVYRSDTAKPLVEQARMTNI